MQTTLDDTIDRYVRTLPILIMALLACTPESTPTWSYVEPLGRDELLESFAEEACGPEQLDYRAIGWPRLAGELTWAILLLRHDPPQGLNEFRDAVTGYYETLRVFAEQQDPRA